MILSVGTTIRRLRLERELTQEDVAMHLGVSAQSVSKWERGDGYPDIEMLPAIAHYFGISTDVLLGADEQTKKEQYDAVNAQWLANNKSGKHTENVALMQDSLKMFPNDALLLVQLSTSLEKTGSTPAEKEKNLRASLEIQEQIIRHCPDCEVRGATLYNICFSYEKLGEHEKALEQAKKLPNLYKARENALVYFLQGDEKHEAAKSALHPLAWCVAHHLTALSETERNPEYLQKALQIIDILFAEENKDVFIQRICSDLKRMNG